MRFEELQKVTAETFGESQFPVALADAGLEVRWANSEAVRIYTGIMHPNGFKNIIVNYESGRILEPLKKGLPANESLVDSSKVRLFPILGNGDIVGCIAFLETDLWGIVKNDMTESFINRLTNEYKLPMTIIFSTLGLIARHMDKNDDTMRTYLKLITQNCYRMFRMSNNIMNAAKFRAGIEKLKLNNGDLGAFVSGLCEAAGILTASLGIPIEVRLPESKVITSFDPTELSNVFLNLFSNSCKYTREGNRIDVKLEVIGNNAAFTVTDSGIGMSDEVLRHVFEPCYSCDPDGRPYGGNGLGLWMVKSIVTLHGGAVAVQSTESIGTKVAFTIPIHIDEKAPDYIAKSSIDYLADRFSALYIEMSDVCGSPMP